MPRPRRPLRRPADVRMFSGWAESVLWGPEPLPYDELGLPAALVADLKRWDSGWSRAAHPDTPTAARLDLCRHNREGRRLARQVADALGSDLALELHLDRPVLRHQRLRGRGPATVPMAAALVRRIQAERAAEEARIAQLLDEGADLRWSPYVPGDPHDDEEPTP